MAKQKPSEKALEVYDEKRLKENVNVGMKGVDPSDIRPPSVLLCQKSSTLEDFVTTDLKKAKVGDYFHTGKMEIYKTFKCYFLVAIKSKYVDRRKPEEGEKDRYRVIGVLADDLSLFAMTFRSSSLYTLSSLFTAVASTQRPMYSYLCEMEVKKLSGKDGEWFVPVLRIRQAEKDAGKLVLLEDMAKSIEQQDNKEKEHEDVIH